VFYPGNTHNVPLQTEWRPRNTFEQDHRGVKRLVRPGLGFGSFWTARRTLAGYEVMAMVR
jgi:transposase-like protein